MKNHEISFTLDDKFMIFHVEENYLLVNLHFINVLLMKITLKVNRFEVIK